MILLADSGGTKTDWALLRPGHSPIQLETIGFNPYFVSSRQMQDAIDKDLAPFFYPDKVKIVHFYGAGTGIPANHDLIHEALEYAFTSAEIEVNTDMLGAARALFGSQPGLPCILGTGSNFCLYDGEKISLQSPSLGYILGDEGSGAYLGKRLLTAYLRKALPSELRAKFDTRYSQDPGSLMESIYRKQAPNTFFASFVPFITDNLDHPFMLQLAQKAFREFIHIILSTIPGTGEFVLGFCGSVAVNFKDIILEELSKERLQAGPFMKNPIEGLIRYHKSV